MTRDTAEHVATLRRMLREATGPAEREALVAVLWLVADRNTTALDRP